MDKIFNFYALFGLFTIIVMILPIMVTINHSQVNNITRLNQKITGGVNSYPIYITNNANFSIYADSGNGSNSNPYLIENYFISNFPNAFMVYITNTNAYFILKNITSEGGDTGFKLNNVSNGQIENCSALYNSNDGFDLSNNITISNSYSIRNAGDGFKLGSNNILNDNFAINNQGNGFSRIFPFNTTMANNKVIISSTDIYSNSYPFYIFQSSGNLLINNTVIFNTSYLILTGFRLDTSSNNTLINNSVYNGEGFYLSNSYDNLIKNNSIYNKDGLVNGITLDQSSSDNNITFNLVLNCMYGFYASYSNYNNIYLNTFFDSNSSQVQGYSNTPLNNFTNGVYGNYWSNYKGLDNNNDGIGDTEYYLDGGTGAIDLYPLMNPVREFNMTEYNISISSNPVSTSSNAHESTSTISNNTVTISTVLTAISTSISTKVKSTPFSILPVILGIFIIVFFRRKKFR